MYAMLFLQPFHTFVICTITMIFDSCLCKFCTNIESPCLEQISSVAQFLTRIVYYFLYYT